MNAFTLSQIAQACRNGIMSDPDELGRIAVQMARMETALNEMAHASHEIECARMFAMRDPKVVYVDFDGRGPCVVGRE